MTKYRLVNKLSVVSLLAVIICAGIFIPFELLGIHEKSAFDSFMEFSSGEELSMGTFTYNDLAEHISLWDAAQYNESQAVLNDGPSQRNGLTVMEASGDDLTILEAQLKSSEELQVLMNMGLLPKMDLGTFSITGAVLYTIENNTSISRWELYFSDHYMVDGGGTDIMISIDSVKGCIYTLSMDSPKGYNMEFTPSQLAEAFALYHNIKDTAAVKDGCLQTTDGLLQIQATIEGGKYNLAITSENNSK